MCGEARPNRPANDKSTPTNYAYDNGHILFHISDNEIRRCLVGHIHYVSPLLPTTDIDFFCDLRCASEYSNRCWAVAQQMAHLAESQDGLEMTKNGLDCASHLFCFVLTVGHVNHKHPINTAAYQTHQAPKASACSYRSMLTSSQPSSTQLNVSVIPCYHSSSDRQPHSSCPGKHALVSAVRSELESPHPSLASPDSFRQVQRHTLSRSHFLAVSPKPYLAIPSITSSRSHGFGFCSRSRSSGWIFPQLFLSRLPCPPRSTQQMHSPPEYARTSVGAASSPPSETHVRHSTFPTRPSAVEPSHTAPPESLRLRDLNV